MSTAASRLFVQHCSSLRLVGGLVLDPFVGRNEFADVCIHNGTIVSREPAEATIIDVSGCLVVPGLLDIHVHFREPGFESKETIASGSAAAAVGGFTGAACMPNTSPAIDTPEVVQRIISAARSADLCDVFPIGAITVGRRGDVLTDFAALRLAGAAAFSDDGVGVENDEVMRAAFEQAQRLQALLIQHCEYKALSGGGIMHLGEVSRRVGMPGIDPRSEEAMIERDLDLCRQTGGRYHVAHISTAKAVELVRVAKSKGIPVTAEVCPHHLVLTDESCADGDPNCKMHPPLRSRADVEACRAGLWDGAIDCIATDHAPHTAEEKARGFLEAPSGIIGLETALGVARRAMFSGGGSSFCAGAERTKDENNRVEPLRGEGRIVGSPHRAMDWMRLISWFTTAPSRVLSLPTSDLSVGRAANLTVIDPEILWNVSDADLFGKSRNTPFRGWTLQGKTAFTLRCSTIVARCPVKTRSSNARGNRAG